MVETLVAAGLSACAKTIGEKMAPKVTGALSGIRAFVSSDLLEEYRVAMEAVFGQGCCYVLQVRPQGGVRVI